MVTRTTTEVGGGPMDILLYAPPSGEGPHRTVMVMHHRDGLDSFTLEFSERLAQQGYLVALPDLYHRRPADEDRAASRKHLDDGEIVADINAAVAHLKKLPSVKADAIAIMGHCMGGRVAYLGMASNPAFKAAAIYYGGSISVAEGAGRPSPLALTENIRCPVIGFFGAQDKNPSPADVAQIDQLMTKHQIRHRFVTYENAGHAFQNHTNKGAYRQEPAEDAWLQLLAFLDEEL